MTFLFWNLSRLPRQQLIANLAKTYHVDVFVLAECDISEQDLLGALNDTDISLYKLPLDPSNRVKIVTRLPLDAVHLVRDTGGISIRKLTPPAGKEILLAAIHLPSKLYQSDVDQTLLCTRFARYIDEAEQSAGHWRTIILGDFNMNPFEVGMIGAEGFHAVMSRDIAQENERVVTGESRRFFYNPMWSFMGDLSTGPPGTYYYRGSQQVTYFWNMFDQVLLRPDLLPYFRDQNVRILTQIGERSLLTAHNRPDKEVGSDHLPLLFQLDFEEAS